MLAFGTGRARAPARPARRRARLAAALPARRAARRCAPSSCPWPWPSSPSRTGSSTTRRRSSSTRATSPSRRAPLAARGRRRRRDALGAPPRRPRRGRRRGDVALASGHLRARGRRTHARRRGARRARLGARLAARDRRRGVAASRRRVRHLARRDGHEPEAPALLGRQLHARRARDARVAQDGVPDDLREPGGPDAGAARGRARARRVRLYLAARSRACSRCSPLRSRSASSPLRPQVPVQQPAAALRSSPAAHPARGRRSRGRGANAEGGPRSRPSSPRPCSSSRPWRRRALVHPRTNEEIKPVLAYVGDRQRATSSTSTTRHGIR